MDTRQISNFNDLAVALDEINRVRYSYQQEQQEQARAQRQIALLNSFPLSLELHFSLRSQSLEQGGGDLGLSLY